MVTYMSLKAAVRASADVQALRDAAEAIAADLDAADTPELRSTLTRTFCTAMTSLRLAEEAYERKHKSDDGPTLADVINIAESGEAS